MQATVTSVSANSDPAMALEPRPSSQVVQGTLAGLESILVRECFSSYDAPQLKKQKCHSHHVKALSESIEKVSGRSNRHWRDSS